MYDHEANLVWDVIQGRLPRMMIPSLERLGAAQWATAVSRLDGIPRVQRMRILCDAMDVIGAQLRGGNR